MSNVEQRCLGCQTRDEVNTRLKLASQAKDATIAKLTSDGQARDETISMLWDMIDQLTAPRQPLPSQSNIAGQSGFMSGAYAPPILLGGHHNAVYYQGLPEPMHYPLRSLSTATSGNVDQATQPGSSTQPSLQATNLTYTSQRETETETSEALTDRDVEVRTLKPFDLGEFLNDDYDPPAPGDPKWFQRLGDQFVNL